MQVSPKLPPLFHRVTPTCSHPTDFATSAAIHPCFSLTMLSLRLPDGLWQSVRKSWCCLRSRIHFRCGLRLKNFFSWECRPRRDLPVRGRLAGRHDITLGTEYNFTSFYLFQHLALQHQGFEQLGDDIHFSSPGRFLEEYGSNGAHYAGIMQTSFGHCPIAVHTMQLANRWCLRQICTAIMYLSSAAWLVCRPVAVQSSHLNNQ